MGNTMIQDSTTGNIMGLRDGFVPVGMKEYGGILYIASFNPQTQEGQLGTIPSPVINYTYVNTPYVCDFTDTKLTNTDFTDLSNTILRSSEGQSKSLINDLLPVPKYLQEPFQISDKRFQVGDQFIVNLNLSNKVITKRYCRYFLTNENGEEEDIINRKRPSYPNTPTPYPLISGFKENNESTDSEIKNYGWFKIVLEAKVERSSDTINLSNISDKRQKYYLEDTLEPIQSDYWFLNEKDQASKLVEYITPEGKHTGLYYLPLDTERCQADDQYRTYPNILPGYLYIRAEVELPENFEFFKNNSTGIKSPNVFLITEPD